jgi:hypothetical protein
VTVTRWAAVPAAIVIAGVAACGGGTSSPAQPPASSPPSPQALTQRVRTALHNASSVHVQGTLQQSAKTVALNLSLNRAGGVSGDLAINGARFGILSTSGHTYIKLTKDFVRYAHLPESACTLMCGKYLKTSPGQSQSVVGGISMNSLFGQLTTAKPDFTYAGSTTVNGRPAWILHGKHGGRAYIAATGQAYPLRFTARSSQAGRLDFTQWNKAKIPPPPPASQVVDPSQLHG